MPEVLVKGSTSKGDPEQRAGAEDLDNEEILQWGSQWPTRDGPDILSKKASGFYIKPSSLGKRPLAEDTVPKPATKKNRQSRRYDDNFMMTIDPTRHT